MKASTILFAFVVLMAFSAVSCEIIPFFPAPQPINFDGTRGTVEPTNPGDNSTQIDRVAIDFFDVNEAPLVISLESAVPPEATQFAAQKKGTILGGERDVQLTVLESPDGLLFTCGTSNGQFTVSTPGGGRARVVLQYDGLDGSPNLDTAVGLGGVDLTEGNAVGIRVEAFSDIATTFTVSMWDSQGRTISETYPTVGNLERQTFRVIYADYAGQFDFASINAIQIVIEALPNVDFTLVTFVTYTNFVPAQAGCIEDNVSPCLTYYYRLAELTDIQPGDYITMTFTAEAEPLNPTSTANFYVLASKFEDLQTEITFNDNIRSTLGGLPGPELYDYKCEGSCEVEIIYSALENTTYYLAVEGAGPGRVFYDICLSRDFVPITNLTDDLPYVTNNDTRVVTPDDNVRHYSFFSIDVPRDTYAEGSYLFVALNRVLPGGQSYTLRLMHESLPVSSLDTGVIGEVDINSRGDQEDLHVFPWCVDTTITPGEPAWVFPVNSQERMPCECGATLQQNPLANQLVCQLTVDPCHFRYGTWYISVELPANVDPVSYTLEANVVRRAVYPIINEQRVSGAIYPESMQHYRVLVKKEDYIFGTSRLVVRLSEVTSGTLDLFIHQGLGVGHELAGGNEACAPANATCRSGDTCIAVIETCNFEPGYWYIGVQMVYDEETGLFSEEREEKLPIRYVLEVDYASDNDYDNEDDDDNPTPLIAGIPATASVGLAQYDFYVIDVPRTVDTTLYIELFAEACDTQVAISVLHGRIPGGDCYARPDFYCLTGDERNIRSSYGPTSFINNEIIQRHSCQYMIQACELAEGPLYISVYGYHVAGSGIYGREADYTLYADFDTPLALTSGVSYSEVVYEGHYQHYYIRADSNEHGQWLSVEVTNIQHGIPQTIEAYVNHNQMAGECPCYDSMYTCTQDAECPRPRDPNAIFAYPDIESVNLCCTIVVPQSDFEPGVYYVSVRGVNEDYFQYTTPIGYTLTVTIHDPPTFDLLVPGVAYTGVAPRWNRTLEYAHFRLGASPVSLNDLVLKLTWVQQCDQYARGKLDNSWEELSLYVNKGRTAGKNPSGHIYHCQAQDIDESYCIIVIPHCQWTGNDYFLAVRGDYEADFDARFTLEATLHEVRAHALTDGVPMYARVEEGLYQHFMIPSEAPSDSQLVIDVYTNQDQDEILAYVNFGQFADSGTCFHHEMSCSTHSACSWVLNPCEMEVGNYYVSVRPYFKQFYHAPTEVTVVASYVPLSLPILENFPVTGHLAQEGFVNHYAFEVNQLNAGHFLEFTVDNVKHGDVTAYAQFGSLSGRCPCYSYEQSCDASSIGQEWCTIRIAPCELQVGTYYFSVVAQDRRAPESAVFLTPVGYTAELRVVEPDFGDIEVDLGRQPEDTVFEELGADKYRHYAISWDDDDFNNGYHLIVEITDVFDADLEVFYNSVTPGSEECNAAQICNDGVQTGSTCMWQLPYCLTRPLNDPINHYITIHNRATGGRQNARYSLHIYKQPVPVVLANPVFTLDQREQFFGHHYFQELNVTHSVSHEPNGWTQFIRLSVVDLEMDPVGRGEILELFFYRITNNAGQPMSFNVYAHPNQPAGAHECCSHDDAGSCQGAPCSHSADTTTEVNGIEQITHTCVLPDGKGDDRDNDDINFGERCMVRIWPCELNKYCSGEVREWFVSVVPIAPVNPTIPGPGLQYSFAWRVRPIRTRDSQGGVIGTVDLANQLNTYDFGPIYPIIAGYQESEGWRSFAIEFDEPLSRLSIQTRFLTGSGIVYIQSDEFASAGPCYDYTCDPTASDCENGGRFIVSECCSERVGGHYYITVRNTGAPGSETAVQFRVTNLTIPTPELIPDHPTLALPFVASSNFSGLPNNIVGVAPENYDAYEIILDDDDLYIDQTWLINVERTDDGNVEGSLEVYVRFGAPGGNYGPSESQSQYGVADEGCHGWQYHCELPTSDSSCLLQIPTCELVEGFWYISIRNPAANLNGLPQALPQYNLTTYITDRPQNLTLNTPLTVTSAENTVYPVGTLMHYSVEVQPGDLVYNVGANQTDDYVTRFLRFQLTQVTPGTAVEFYVSYDHLAGPNEGGCTGSYTDQICQGSSDSSFNGCYFDFLPCEAEASMRLVTGTYFVSVRLLTTEPTSYELLATVLTQDYQELTSVDVNNFNGNIITQYSSSFHDSNTTDRVWQVDVAGGATTTDPNNYGYYMVDISRDDAVNVDDDDLAPNQYILFNISAPGVGVEDAQGLAMRVWSDDCSIYECALDGPLTWCTIDATHLAPGGAKGGRYYIRVDNPAGIPFTLNAYRNETYIQEIADRQVITEYIIPYQYQEYFYSSSNVDDGATLTARICSVCGDVEAWIRPDLPAGPNAPGARANFSLDHCSIANGGNSSAFTLAEDSCCDLFLDTCEYEQRGYYVGVRGVHQTYGNEEATTEMIPILYSIEVFQTTVDVEHIDPSCAVTVEHTQKMKHAPRQYAVDLETINLGSSLRLSLVVANNTEDPLEEGDVATLRFAVNETVGYSSACPLFGEDEYSCSTNTNCSIIIPYCAFTALSASHIYVAADAPRGSIVLVERWDPIAPVVENDVVYHSSISGPNPVDNLELPYQENTQMFRFNLAPVDDDDYREEFIEEFFARVIVTGHRGGVISAAVNSGYLPYVNASACEMPVFYASCDNVALGDECIIDIDIEDLYSDASYFGQRLSSFWLTVNGMEQSCELNAIQFSFVIQTKWKVAFYPVGSSTCHSLKENEYEFYHLTPRASPRDQESILRFELSDLDDGESVTLMLDDGHVANMGHNHVQWSSRLSLNGSIAEDYYCGYDNLHMSLYGEQTADDDDLQFRLSVTEIPLRLKKLFDDSVYHADDDDDDACPHEHDFYVFPRMRNETASVNGTFFRVAVDSEYPTEVYVNRGSIAWKNCHNAASGYNDPRDSGTTTVNVYDFCDYDDEPYYITVVSRGPYYIYTDLRDDPKKLSLGQVHRDELEPGMYRMYTLEIPCDFESDDRLVVEITDIEHGDVYGWIEYENNAGFYNHSTGAGECAISTTMADYGANESGYNFLLVDSCELKAGRYHILIRAAPHEGSPERDCQHVKYRLFPYLINYQIDPQRLEPNTPVNGTVDLYTVNRFANDTTRRIDYYEVRAMQDPGFLDTFSHAVVRLANVTGGLLRLRVMSGHLATPEYGFFSGELYGVSQEEPINNGTYMQSGRRPNTYQRMLDSRTSVYQNECDGCSDFCCEMTQDDLDQYQTDRSCAIWIPSCYLRNESIFIAVESVEQFYFDELVNYTLVMDLEDDFKLINSSQVETGNFTEDNWDYHFYYSFVPHRELESMRWRVNVSEGEGVLVSVRNHRCPHLATWNRQIWCDADYANHPWMCDIEIPTRAAHPGALAFYVSVYGKNATYTLESYRGVENCHRFAASGRNEGLDFCAGLVPYYTWSWENYETLDNEAHCFFEQLYSMFRVQPCYSGVTAQCNATLAAFACYESFRACDATGFAVPTCRDVCQQVEQTCDNSFSKVNFEAYECNSLIYGDREKHTCTAGDTQIRPLRPPVVRRRARPSATPSMSAPLPRPTVANGEENVSVSGSSSLSVSFIALLLSLVAAVLL